MEKLMEVARDNPRDRLILELSRLWRDQQDRSRAEKAIQALSVRYDLKRKITREPGVAGILQQMFGRLANSYGSLADIQNKRILDIACGSNTSQLPASYYFTHPLSEMAFGRLEQEYTALFEPWFCRILYELGAAPVGVDIGDLEGEFFTHLKVDLGKPGALDFLPSASFDAIQDSRLFGSPEFTARFPQPADHLQVAREIVREERRLLKLDGIIIHSDAMELLK
jgi:hypothetical protein